MAPCHNKAAPQLCLALHAPSSSNPGKSPHFGAEQRRTEPTQMEERDCKASRACGPWIRSPCRGEKEIRKETAGGTLLVVPERPCPRAGQSSHSRSLQAGRVGSTCRTRTQVGPLNHLRKSPPAPLMLVPPEHNLLLPAATLLTHVADVDGVDPEVSVQLLAPTRQPSVKFVYSFSLFLQNYTSRNYAKSNSKAYRLKQQTARKYQHLVDSTLRNYWEVNLSWSRTPTMWSKQGIRLCPGQGRNKILSRCSLSEHRSFWALNRAWIMQKKMVHDRVIKDCHKINT